MQTLNAVTGIPADRACSQLVPGEHHPAWTLGHLLLGDSYLLMLLGVDDLPADFQILIDRYGPEASPTPVADRDHGFAVLIDRLTATGTRRDAAVVDLSPVDLTRPTPDPILARAQPTIGHHLHALVCHEGYHGGRLASWRRAHGFPPAGWAFAPPPDPPR